MLIFPSIKSVVANANRARARAAAVFAVTVFISLGFTVNISFANPAGTIHYPDLQTLPPTDIGIGFDPETGKKLLRFSNTIANLGEGPLEVVPTNNPTTGTTDAYQRLYGHDEMDNWYVASTIPVGTFIFHTEHHHWHFEDFARYELHNVAPDGSIDVTVLASSEKVSFCLTDYEFLSDGLEHAGGEAYSPFYCAETNAQGISVGWADEYTFNLPGQSLDITGLPEGEYWLVSTADPDNLLEEGGGAAESNNTVALKVRIANEFVWMDDTLPEGAETETFDDLWTWVGSDPTPYSGLVAHQSMIRTGVHQHLFNWVEARLAVNSGNILFTYVYLDPANLPSELMLEWSDGFSWAHRAYWGANRIDVGVNGTASRVHMGPLPPAGQWVRLEVPARLVDLEGIPLSGMSFTLFDGRATWDYVGVRVAQTDPSPPDRTPPTVVITAPTNAATVSGIVAVSAYATDSGDVGGVQFKLDGINLGHEIIIPPYSASWDSSTTTNGSHTLIAVARDAAGNQTASIPVTVVVSNIVFGGDTLPVCDAGGPYAAECQGRITRIQLDGSRSSDPSGGVLTYAWTTDCGDAGFDDPASPTPMLALGSASIPGTCHVTLIVTDHEGSSGTSSATVTISDTEPPMISCPSGVVMATDPGQCSAVVNFALAVADNCSEPTVVCSPPSGSIFPEGVTTVECAANDAAGNQSTCSFTVMVNDAQAPTIRCPANVETPTDPGRCTAYVTFEPTAGDNCTGVTLECVPPSGTDFPIGTSTVTCIAAGGSGGTAQCTFVVAVTAGTEPALPYRFWKNHPNSWPSRAMPMTLGTQSYNQEELLAHLSAPTTGDASLILARQMIVATLNTANGSDPRPVCDDLRQAHRLLSGFSGRLPYNVHPSSASRQEMVNIANLLRAYNNEPSTP